MKESDKVSAAITYTRSKGYDSWFEYLDQLEFYVMMCL